MSSEAACPIIVPAYLSDTAPLDTLLSLVDGRKTSLADYPLASSLAQDLIPVYDAPALRKSGHLTTDWTDAACLPLKEEFIRALKLGPGVVIFKKAWEDKELLARATGVLQSLIDEQRAIDTVIRNQNYIVANTSGKWAQKDPESYAQYFKNDVLALVSAAWLGPWYQMTSQISQCVPGNVPQNMHRDYHLGSAVADPLRRGDDVIGKSVVPFFPAHIHASSHFLTLQGAAAHCDMPLESGPTHLLPYSQLFDAGYMTQKRPDFIDYFKKNSIQSPLEEGDALFFSPGIYHGAGKNISGPETNTEPINRIANLFQVSSAFGRPMDYVDRQALVNDVYPYLLSQKKLFKESQGTKGFSNDDLWNIIASTAEGYRYPTNNRLIHGLSQTPQAEVVYNALQAEMPADKLMALLEEEDRVSKAGQTQ